MMFKRIVLILGLVASSSAGLANTGAYASTPTPASGTFDITIMYTGATAADGNTIIQFTLIEHLAGTFIGTRVGSGMLILHPDGTLNARDSGVFTGTVAGSQPGTAIGSVEASGSVSALTGQFQATMGTGGLAGIHGQVGFSGAAVSASSGGAEFTGTYSGQVESAAA